MIVLWVIEDTKSIYNSYEITGSRFPQLPVAFSAEIKVIITLAILFVIEYPFLGIFCYMKTIGVFVFATKLFCDEIMI